MRAVLALLLGLVASAGSEDPAMPDPRPGDIRLNIGATDESEGQLGFGWSRREHVRDETFRWMEHLEADATFELERDSDLEVWIDAAPLYLNWRKQQFGLYLNGRFIAEQVMPHDHLSRVYLFHVPARFVREGTNSLTLRAGYRHRVGRERRELALAVRSILIRPLTGED